MFFHCISNLGLPVIFRAVTEGRLLQDMEKQQIRGSSPLRKGKCCFILESEILHNVNLEYVLHQDEGKHEHV